MKLIADALIPLPFSLDFCARGPDVDPLVCTINGFAATLFFPPSLSEGTDGQGIFGEWAWWKGKTLRLVLEKEISDNDETEELRKAALATACELLRRFLNSCRWRFDRPEVHPVVLDARTLSLSLQHENGTIEALPEPFGAFFYHSMPQEPPLEASINSSTLETLRRDVQSNHAPPLSAQMRLDAEALEAQGENERAIFLRELSEEL